VQHVYVVSPLCQTVRTLQQALLRKVPHPLRSMLEVVVSMQVGSEYNLVMSQSGCDKSAPSLARLVAHQPDVLSLLQVQAQLWGLSRARTRKQAIAVSLLLEQIAWTLPS
jgi:hypothetical protein